MSKRVVRLSLATICLIYASVMLSHASRLMAIYRDIAANNGDGVGGDGYGIYEPVDAQLWEMGLFTLIAICTVLLISWLTRRNSN